MSHSDATQVSSLVSGAVKSENWDLNVQILDNIQTKPDETVSTIIRDLRKHFESYLREMRKDSAADPRHILNALTLLDACLKNSGQFFLNQYRVHGLDQCVESLKNSSSEKVRSKVESYLEQWPQEVEGWKSPPPSKREREMASHSPVTHSPSRTKSSKAAPQSPQEKIMRDLDSVKESTILLNDIIDNASSFDQIANATTFQLMVNIKEMVRRLRHLIDTIPEEQVLLKALSMYEFAFDTLSNYDALKEGRERNKVTWPSEDSSKTTTTSNAASSNSPKGTNANENKSSQEQDLLDFRDVSPGANHSDNAGSENNKSPDLDTFLNRDDNTPQNASAPSAPPPDPNTPKKEEDDPFAAISKRKSRKKGLPPLKSKGTIPSSASIPKHSEPDPNDPFS